MRRVLFLASVVALLPPAAGADGLKFSPQAIHQCMDGGDTTACIGRAAQACMEETEGGYSTPGMAGCLDAERDFWDGILNNAYGELRSRAREIDAEEPIEGFPPRPSDTEALRDMQRAWIAYRDATCRYEELQWWGGTGATGANIGCQMQMTGERALALRTYLIER